nr:glycosyl hydrolase family 18 protein [uncultured Cellulosilyticum sp.]
MGLLQVGSKVPSFTASSTQGLVDLNSYKGQWVLLVCSPTAFNTARKNEIITLMKHASTLKKLSLQVLPVCMDQNAAHLSWFYSTVHLGNYKMPFPIVDDREGRIGKIIGLAHTNMRQANTEVLLISPEQTLVEQFSVPVLNNVELQNIVSTFEGVKNSYRPQPIQSTENQPIGTNPYCQVTSPIVGEYVLGNPSNVDANLLDFAIYAFALINPDGTFTVYSTRYLEELVNLKSENPSIKIILAIGGWGADGFSDAALTPTSRYAFAREAKRWVDEYGLDGIDIDWEYPGSSAAGIKSRPQDTENFTLLLTALRDVLGADAWISVAGTGETSYINSVEIANIAPIINYFNLMAYDFTAGETGPGAAKHQANLYPSELALNNTSIDGQVNNLIAAGMPSYQILLGIPFYGRYGATDTKTFDDLRKNFLNQDGYQIRWDNTAKAAYVVDSRGNFVYSYDNLLSIYFKGLYVVEKCLGGMFSWQSSMDKANILTSGMSQAIRNMAGLEKLLAEAYYTSIGGSNNQ